LGADKVRVCDDCYLESLDNESRKIEKVKIDRQVQERQAKERLQLQEKQQSRRKKTIAHNASQRAVVQG
jgi:hypothetical protein